MANLVEEQLQQQQQQQQQLSARDVAFKTGRVLPFGLLCHLSSHRVFWG
jgi:hypothetical protein